MPNADWLIRKGVLADMRAKVIKQSRAVSALNQKLFAKKAERPDVKERLFAEIRNAGVVHHALQRKRDAATDYGTKEPAIRLSATEGKRP